MAPVVVPGFLPSTSGFHFANDWPAGPTVRLGPFDTRWFFGIGDAAAGLCGGMALSAKDIFESPSPLRVPADTQHFANGSPRFDQIVRRQVQSLQFGLVPLRYYSLSAFRPDPPNPMTGAIGREPPRVDAIRRWWPEIKKDIDEGKLPVVGLIRKASNNPLELVGNHQVLAYGYDETPERITIRIYDPNWPGNDTVELRATISPDVDRPWRDRIKLEQSTGEPLLGFFKHPYPEPDSLKAWR
jgi:hypothetical protein